MKKINIENGVSKYYIIIGSVCILAVIILLVLTINENTRQYLVQKGTLEYTELATGYIVKNERTILKDPSMVLVPVVTEGSRVSKSDVIATYKGEEYTNYEENLIRMDTEILERMQYLPVVYSSEVDAIEKTIYSLVKQSMGTTSYNKMQEYKQKINTYINKRANIIGELSPDGAEIKKLIKERNEYEAKAKKSNDNILAPIPGIVSYTIDGLEEILTYNDVKDLDYWTIKNTILEKKQSDNTKIKVVNNYEAYIVMKVNLENERYIVKGYNYRLRLIEQENYELIGKLEKIKQVEDGIEVYFKVTNGIKSIVNLRETEIEIVWDCANGLIVPTKSLNKYEEKQAYYITSIKYGEYKNIPAKVSLKNENYAVVDNYTDEELDELDINNEYKLKLYDRIIVESKK